MPADVNAILQIQVPLIVQIGSRAMSVRDVTSLAPGAIIELPKQADDELDVLVNNKAIGAGAAVKVGENFGVRITSIGDVRQRIRAMGTHNDPGLSRHAGDVNRPAAAAADVVEELASDDGEGD